MFEYIEFLNIPEIIAIAIVALFLISQIIGEIIELFGKVAPSFLKVRKYLSKRKKERVETQQTLKDVKQLLGEVNVHYSDDNIAKRNAWIDLVNNRIDAYDNSIVEISNKLENVTNSLNANTKMTEKIFVQTSRDRIIDFASKVGDDTAVISKEEFNRIYKIHKEYEEFLSEHNLTNGEVDIAMRVIDDAYSYRLAHHSFLENIRGYVVK